MSCLRHSAPAGKLSGTLIITPHEGGPTQYRDTCQCVHCMYTWVAQPGSGKRRGICLRCNGLTCGHAKCEARGCVHKEQWLSNVEAGRPEDYRPIVARVEGEVPGG